MLLNNTRFTNNALYLNGLYHEASGYYASTPYLNLLDANNNLNLTFSLKFFSMGFGLNNSTYPQYRDNIIKRVVLIIDGYPLVKLMIVIA